jgi:hypothetical protein
MRQSTTMMTFVATMCATILAASAHAQGAKPLTVCPPDAVVSGTVCMDTYEASAWREPRPVRSRSWRRAGRRPPISTWDSAVCASDGGEVSGRRQPQTSFSIACNRLAI